MKKSIFITATDTNVGKTFVTAMLGKSLQAQGFKVGVMKPVQCGGDDAAFLKKSLGVDDDLSLINSFFAPEPLSPHLAFQRAGITFDLQSITEAHRKLQEKYDIVLIEGAGGWLVPLAENYFVADLARDLNADVVLVSRPGLGTINHSLLTIQDIQRRGLNLLGVIFNQSQPNETGIAEQTNPEVVARLGDVSVLGNIPYIRHPERSEGFLSEILRLAPQNDDFNINKLMSLLATCHVPLTASLKNLDKKYVWHPFTQMKDWLEDEPIVIDRADGNYLFDSDGNKYLDGVSSLWVTVHGHNHPHINQRLHQQIEKLDHSSLLGLANTPSIELAEKLIKIAPKGLEKVFYSDSGSTSVEVAIKMVYQYWQNTGRPEKKWIAHLENSYHGDTLGSVSVGGIDLFHKVYRNLMFSTIQVTFESFESTIRERHHEIAAFIVEPLVQGAAGMIMWPQGVLKRFHEICKKYDVIFIADEVATGFGRTGKMFACEHEGVTPDIMCLAKGLTGGYLPLAATLTTKKIFDGFVFDYKDQKTFFHGHTYTGNPLACAAAIASLEVFENEGTLEKLQPKIKSLSRKLGMLYNLASVGEVRQCGFMVGIELMKDRATKEPFPWEERMGARVCREARKHGVMLRPLGNVIVLMPPLSILEKELEQLVDAVHQSVENVCHSCESSINIVIPAKAGTQCLLNG